MTVAYADTSCFVAIAFGEPGATRLAERLAEFDEVVASNLLEAELRTAFAREGVPYEPTLVAGLSWLLPDAPLGPQMERALAAGYLRGADLWHVACALYVADPPTDLTFLSLDERQRAVAGKLGFQT